MNNQKLENMLNLAISASEEERDKSLELNVGYNPIGREWDLIVKYSGSLDCVRALTAPFPPTSPPDEPSGPVPLLTKHRHASDIIRQSFPRLLLPQRPAGSFRTLLLVS